MAIKFMGKNPHKKYVRHLSNRRIQHIVEQKTTPTVEVDTVPPIVKEEIVEEIVENKEVNTEEDMKDKRLENIENIMGVKAPKRKTKIEKKEKGLIERTETVILNEDNKMLLND